ncbi:MAG: hypothetical protein FJ220_01850, partial [Kiritimatiellaceae bacterium]|nr:hypothetical protein [Kiritimatiellaceae bacterium]
MKKFLNFAGRLINTASGFLGGLIFAVLVILSTSSSIRLFDMMIPHLRGIFWLLVCMFPFIGAKLHYKFIWFFTPLFCAFANDCDGTVGQTGDDNPHMSFKDVLIAIAYLAGVTLCIFTFFFTALIPH